jgi:hypothetical protein
MNCIDNILNGSVINLTTGKFYKVLHKTNYEVYLLNDKGVKSSYSISRFIDISKYREMQLNKILTQ